MSYTAIPDRHMPYDNDGTVVLQRNDYPIIGTAQSYPSGTDLQAMNGFSGVTTGRGASTYGYPTTILFFPEQREVSALYIATTSLASGLNFAYVEGSNNTTNGQDGTWETASVGAPITNASLQATEWDQWRAGIFTVSFTGPKQVLRIRIAPNNPSVPVSICILHVYGQKGAGQTPDDVIILNGNTSFTEFVADADFGDRPLGTTSVWTFKVKNASGTHTANTINIQLNDADFAISTDNITYVNTINISSLAAGASSATMYIRNTTPSPGNAMGPRFARMIITVASYT